MNSFELIKAVESYPSLSSVLGYETLVDYVNLISYLKPTIALQQASYHLDPPESPTVPIHEFIKVCLGMSDEATKQAWTALRTLAWAREVTEADEEALQHKYIGLFMEHGLSRGISESCLLWPIRSETLC